LVGAALGAGGVSAVQSLAPYLAEETAKGGDPNGAFDRALLRAGQEGAFTGASWALFGWAPFKQAAKDILFQAFVAQPGAAVAQRGVENVEQGKPVTEGMSEAALNAAVTTAIPAAGHAVVSRLAGHPSGPAPSAETPPAVPRVRTPEEIENEDGIGPEAAQRVAATEAVKQPAAAAAAIQPVERADQAARTELEQTAQAVATPPEPKPMEATPPVASVPPATAPEAVPPDQRPAMEVRSTPAVKPPSRIEQAAWDYADRVYADAMEGGVGHLEAESASHEAFAEFMEGTADFPNVAMRQPSGYENTLSNLLAEYRRASESGAEPQQAAKHAVDAFEKGVGAFRPPRAANDASIGAIGRPDPGTSLLPFLIERGGLQPHGDLRAMDAHIARPGLVRKTGMQLDYAREAAAEAGFLPMDSTIGDFLDLVSRELKGQKQYGNHLPEQITPGVDVTGREEARREALTEDVRMAADDAGVQLGGATLDHAVQLAQYGMPVAQAIHEATRFGSNVEDVPFGRRLPVPPQSGAPLLGERSPQQIRQELTDADAAFRAGEPSYQQTLADYRSRKIGDDEYLTARKARDALMERYDRAYEAVQILPPERATAQTAEPTIRNDPRQLGLLGTEPSAVQAQAARDQAGPRGGQKPADEGLFAPKETEQNPLFGRRGFAGANPVGVRQQLERNLSSLDLLDPRYPAMPLRSVAVPTVGRQLMERGQSALRMLGIRSGKIEGPAPHTDELLSRSLASEAKAALQRAWGTGGSGFDWYTRKVRQAMAAATTIHPEIETDPNARMGFTAALAITSQGETVPLNVRLAEPAYAYFKENGRFPTDIKAKKAAAMNRNFAKLNALMDAHEQIAPGRGVDGLRDFLSRDFTVRELTAMGHKIGGENLDTAVKGSAILGPKIGQGFYQNLNGNYNPVAMDLWFMRTWGRLTGTLVGLSPEVVAKQQERLRTEMALNQMKVPQTTPGLLKEANRIFDAHEKHFNANREDYNSGKYTKSELVLAARSGSGYESALPEPASCSRKRGSTSPTLIFRPFCGIRRRSFMVSSGDGTARESTSITRRLSVTSPAAKECPKMPSPAQWAPWISDPDPEEKPMSDAEIKAFARKAAAFMKARPSSDAVSQQQPMSAPTRKPSAQP
jgi:hypothetical protein